MNVSTRPDCKRCKTPLSGEVIEHITVCPSCGKRWELTPDLTAIKSITLEVQDATLKVGAVILTGKDKHD